MKKMNPIVLVCCVIVVALGVFLIYRSVTAERAFKTFEETAKIRHGDIVYDAVKRPLFGNGFILYRVRIPSLNVPHTIEKAVIHPLPESGVGIRLYDVRVPVVEALRQLYGHQIVSVMQSYRPYVDVLRHPLVTLGVMDAQTARFNLALKLQPALTGQTIQGKIALRELADIAFTGTIAPLPEGTKNPVFALYGQLTRLSVQLTERGGLNRYRLYAASTGLPVPTGVPRPEMKQKTEVFSFTFNPPVSMTPVYLRRPH